MVILRLMGAEHVNTRAGSWVSFRVNEKFSVFPRIFRGAQRIDEAKVLRAWNCTESGT